MLCLGNLGPVDCPSPARPYIPESEGFGSTHAGVPPSRVKQVSHVAHVSVLQGRDWLLVLKGGSHLPALVSLECS